MTPKLPLSLREYKAERESLHWHPGIPLTLDNLVFANERGKPIGSSTLSHNLGRIVWGGAAGRFSYECAYSSVDRASVFGTEGRGFESL